jgi:hypothetical protein
MKQMINTIKKLVFFTAIGVLLGACNKDEITTRAVSIQINGYNVGNSELQVTIDTVVYDKFKTAPNKLVNFRNVYTYPSSKGQALLKIKDLVSGKEVYQQSLELNTKELERFLPFVFINGSALEIKPPAADPSTNKMAFYIYYPQSSDGIDVFLKNDAGQIGYIAKNVQPATWVYTNYVATKEFADPNKHTLYFTKTGTIDNWAFDDSEQMSKTPTGTLLLPNMSEKGRVCSYFITPGSNQLEAVRLFKGAN